MAQQLEAPSVRECDMTLDELAAENARKARLYDEAVKVARKVGGRTAALATEPVSTVLYALSAERADFSRIVERGRLELAGEAIQGLLASHTNEGSSFEDIAADAALLADCVLRALAKAPAAEAGPATDADRPDPQTEGGAYGVKSST